MSITEWFGQLKNNNPQAAGPLWENYFPRLVNLARKMLQDAPRRVRDEEDLALSAFASLCRGAQGGKFGDYSDRDDLWRLLVVITRRKVLDQIDRECCSKRGGGKVRCETDMPGADATTAAGALDQIDGQEPSPEFVALMADECRRLLGRLNNAELQQIALWKMEGYTNQEIATKLNRLERRIEKKLKLIREIWEKEAA